MFSKLLNGEISKKKRFFHNGIKIINFFCNPRNVKEFKYNDFVNTLILSRLCTWCEGKTSPDKRQKRLRRPSKEFNVTHDEFPVLGKPKIFKAYAMDNPERQDINSKLHIDSPTIFTKYKVPWQFKTRRIQVFEYVCAPKKLILFQVKLLSFPVIVVFCLALEVSFSHIWGLSFDWNN